VSSAQPPLTFQPSAAALAALRRHWGWQLGQSWTPLLFSVLGDVFVELSAGTVWWLSTATGALEQVADTRADFAAALAGERADEWFLPGLVDVLWAQGKVLADDQCYTFAVFPVFAEGSFSAENLHPQQAAVHFRLSGQLHERIRHLPDGTAVPAVLDADGAGSA
jgi:hypothetical protein